jgi:hypothetical protein
MLPPDTYIDFDDFVRQTRYLSSPALNNLQKYLDELVDSNSVRSSLVVVHGPFPESSRLNGVEESTDTDSNSDVGLGTGKSDFLSLASRRLSELGFNVIVYEDTKRRTEEFTNFFRDIFLDLLIESCPDLLLSRREQFVRWLQLVWSKFSLLVSTALPPFLLVVTYLLTWFGFRAIEFVATPTNASFLSELLVLFTRYQVLFFTIGLVLLFAWFAYSWGALLRDEEQKKRWDNINEQYRAFLDIDGAKRRIAQQPQRIVNALASRSQRVAVLIDDVDSIDEESCRQLVRLVEESREARTCQLVMLFTYNPSSPILRRSDRSWMRNALSPLMLIERGFNAIEVQIIDSAELTGLLWSYYREPQAEQQQRQLEFAYPEARSNTGMLLAFFRFVDKKLGTENLLSISDQDLEYEFEQFLNRDHRVVEEILSAIEKKAGAHAAGCLELLKYVLAHRTAGSRKRTVRVANLVPLMGDKFANNVESYLAVLAANEIALLDLRRDAEGQYVQFRYAYMCAALNTGWQEWRQQRQNYYTEVFSFMHTLRELKWDDEELALRCSPSKLAVDVLWRAGEYNFRFAGATTIGTALRYYEDALQKLLVLINEAEANNESVWDLVRVKRWGQNDLARLNPLWGWSNESYSVSRYGNDIFVFHLIYMVGRLAWLQGDWRKAKNALTRQWPEVVRILAPHASIEKDRQDLVEASREISVAYLEMLYSYGREDSWDEVLEITGIPAKAGTNTSENDQYIMYDTLVTYHRCVGIGNELPDLNLLKSVANLSECLRLAQAPNLSIHDKARLLCLCLDGYWQLINVTLPDLNILDSSHVQMLEFDQAAWNALKDVLARLNALLAETSKLRQKRRSSWILWPDVRSEQAWHVVWEAYYYLYRCRDFRLTMSMYFIDLDKLLQQKSSRTHYAERQDAMLTLIQRMKMYLATNCEEYLSQSPEFAETCFKLEESANKSIRYDRVEWKRKEETYRKGIAKLYEYGYKVFQVAAAQKMSFAEVAFRELGHEPGLFASRFGKIEVSRISNHAVAFGVQPSWLLETKRFLRAEHGVIGYRLEAILAYLRMGVWGQVHDIPLSSSAFISAKSLLEDNKLRLPKVILGELNFQIGAMLGNSEHIKGTPENIIEYFDSAKVIFDSLDNSSSYRNEDVLVNRQIMTAWWRAELSLRRVEGTEGSDERNKLLRRTLLDCDFVIRRANRVAETTYVRNTARVIKGKAFEYLEEVDNAYREYKTASDYFIKSADDYWILQVVSRLLSLVTRYDSSSANWVQCQQEVHDRYSPHLMAALQKFELSTEKLNYSQRLVYYRACNVVGRVYGPLQTSIHWLEVAFGILESLGLYGSAVNLNSVLRAKYSQAGDIAGFTLHLQKVVLALQKLDPLNDVVPDPKNLSTIMSDLGLKSLFSQTEHIKTKEEIIESVEHVLACENPEYVDAITLLLKARNLHSSEQVDQLDLQVLALLRTIYYTTGDFVRAKEISGLLAQETSLMRCATLLELAMYFKRQGMQYQNLLKSATVVPIDCDCYRRATAELAAVSVEEWTGGVVEAQEVDVNAELEVLLTKPSNLYSQQDSEHLFHLLEAQLREFVASRLRNLSPSWWKQRVPIDVKRRAEDRKSERDDNVATNGGRTFRVYEFLDFNDLARLITMNNNWEDAFDKVFPSKGFVTVKLGELSPLRNDIAHSRTLTPHDRDLLVNTARQFIRIIRESELPVITPSSDTSESESNSGTARETPNQFTP